MATSSCSVLFDVELWKKFSNKNETKIQEISQFEKVKITEDKTRSSPFVSIILTGSSQTILHAKEKLVKEFELKINSKQPKSIVRKTQPSTDILVNNNKWNANKETYRKKIKQHGVQLISRGGTDDFRLVQLQTDPGKSITDEQLQRIRDYILEYIETSLFGLKDLTKTAADKRPQTEPGTQSNTDVYKFTIGGELNAQKGPSGTSNLEKSEISKTILKPEIIAKVQKGTFAGTEVGNNFPSGSSSYTYVHNIDDLQNTSINNQQSLQAGTFTMKSSYSGKSGFTGASGGQKDTQVGKRKGEMENYEDQVVNLDVFLKVNGTQYSNFQKDYGGQITMMYKDGGGMYRLCLHNRNPADRTFPWDASQRIAQMYQSYCDHLTASSMQHN